MEHQENVRREFLKKAGIAAASVALTKPVSAMAQSGQTLGTRFEDKVVLITGATSGIGETTAYAFAREGATVFFCGRREHLGERNAANIRAFGGEATYMRADVRVEADVRAFVAGCLDRYGRLDIAFNNAGIGQPLNLLADSTLEEWDDVINTNARGVFLAMKYQLPVMEQQGGGVIINTASISASIGSADGALYHTSKHAVLGLTRCAALGYGAKNIRVNAISPGAVQTAMLEDYMEQAGLDAEALASFYPVRRIGSTEDIARAVLWLASEEASFISGEDVRVDGGFLSK